MPTHTQAIVAKDTIVRGMYVERFYTILGNIEKENELLQYASKHKFNYLCLYKLRGVVFFPGHQPMKLSNRMSRALSDFIVRAKRDYQINQIGVSGSDSLFFKCVMWYNNQTHLPGKIDVVNYEYEFWISEHTATSDPHLSAPQLAILNKKNNAHRFKDVFLPMLDQIKRYRDTCLYQPLIEVYLGYLHKDNLFDDDGGSDYKQAAEIDWRVDRILLHFYLHADNFEYLFSWANKNYGKRLEYFGGLNTKPKTHIIPLFSAEQSSDENYNFMGEYLKRSAKPEDVLERFYHLYNSINVNYNNQYSMNQLDGDNQLQGIMWFKYGLMPK